MAGLINHVAVSLQTGKVKHSWKTTIEAFKTNTWLKAFFDKEDENQKKNNFANQNEDESFVVVSQDPEADESVLTVHYNPNDFDGASLPSSVTDDEQIDMAISDVRKRDKLKSVMTTAATSVSRKGANNIAKVKFISKRMGEFFRGRLDPEKQTVHDDMSREPEGPPGRGNFNPFRVGVGEESAFRGMQHPNPLRMNPPDSVVHTLEPSNLPLNPDPKRNEKSDYLMKVEKAKRTLTTPGERIEYYSEDEGEFNGSRKAKDQDEDQDDDEVEDKDSTKSRESDYRNKNNGKGGLRNSRHLTPAKTMPYMAFGASSPSKSAGRASPAPQPAQGRFRPRSGSMDVVMPRVSGTQKKRNRKAHIQESYDHKALPMVTFNNEDEPVYEAESSATAERRAIVVRETLGLTEEQAIRLQEAIEWNEEHPDASAEEVSRVGHELLDPVRRDQAATAASLQEVDAGHRTGLASADSDLAAVRALYTIYDNDGQAESSAAAARRAAGMSMASVQTDVQSTTNASIQQTPGHLYEGGWGRHDSDLAATRLPANREDPDYDDSSYLDPVSSPTPLPRGSGREN